jgi:glyoxylase-like metal-dependent hydrolase (beta-lactamase superfamily II)
VRIDRLEVGALQTNCFLVSADESSPAFVIDPAGGAERVLEAIGGRDVAAVVLTHGHFDHLGAATEVMEATGAPLWVHEADAEAVSSAWKNGARLFGFSDAAPEPDRRLADGDELWADGLLLCVLHTPGHTPGGISLLGDGHLFCGDTVFAGSVGRTDFPGGSARELRRSIETKIAVLPDDTVVHPGHGPDTTVGAERARNPFFPRG